MFKFGAVVLAQATNSPSQRTSWTSVWINSWRQLDRANQQPPSHKSPHLPHVNITFHFIILTKTNIITNNKVRYRIHKKKMKIYFYLRWWVPTWCATLCRYGQRTLKRWMDAVIWPRRHIASRRGTYAAADYWWWLGAVLARMHSYSERVWHHPAIIAIKTLVLKYLNWDNNKVICT